MFPVQQIETPGTDQPSLLAGPGHHVRFVVCPHGHGHKRRALPLHRRRGMRKHNATTKSSPAITLCPALAEKSIRFPYLLAGGSELSPNPYHSIHCNISRSVTVGIPKSRIPPPVFGIFSRRTGLGRYLPFRNASRIPGQCVLSYAAVSAIVCPSTPALPRLALTRFPAFTMFALASACVSRSSRPEPSSPCRAGRASSRNASGLASPRPPTLRPGRPSF